MGIVMLAGFVLAWAFGGLIVAVAVCHLRDAGPYAGDE